MKLIAFDGIHRRSWMFQRNLRKIYPWKVSQILSLLHMQLETETWSGNQEIQNNFTKKLEGMNLKREGVQYDPHSGGARTYFSQLSNLGLVFKREDKTSWLTIAGEDLVNGNHSPSQIIRTQLLNHQYPSIYSSNRNVSIHPDIKVKPFLFILELLLDTEINYLTVEEIIIPVLYGHNHNCIALCKDKILQFRQSNSGLLSVIDNPSEDFYTAKTANSNIKKILSNYNDIANTCKNYLESCSLVICDVLDGTRIQTISINESILDEIEQALKKKMKFTPVHSEEQFQRKYGAWNKLKDSRQLKRGTSKTNNGEPIIHALFAEFAGKNLVLEMPEDFISQTIEEGFKRDLIISTIKPYLINSLSLYEQKFIELSIGGRKTANEFEKAVEKLFSERLKYKTTHTGQKFRKGKVGGYSDIFLKEESARYCAIIDTKASPKYNLSATDFHTMQNSYIPSIKELNEYNGEELGFCAYVAGGFTANINNRVKTLSKESGYNFTAIRAYDLLKLSQKNITNKKQNTITDIFRTQKLLDINDFELL